MGLADWTIVVALNGGIVLYGLLRGRDTKTSADRFLAGRTLPWWMIGLSLYPTVIDASNLVADSGGTYVVGLSYLVTSWVGVAGGWVLLANWIAVPMYRAGMYTNLEYLEARFDLSAACCRRWSKPYAARWCSASLPQPSTAPWRSWAAGEPLRGGESCRSLSLQPPTPHSAASVRSRSRTRSKSW